MKRFLKRRIVIVTTAIFVMSVSMIAYAENINHVNLTFSGTAPREGESLGEIGLLVMERTTIPFLEWVRSICQQEY